MTPEETDMLKTIVISVVTFLIGLFTNPKKKKNVDN